MLSCSSRDSWVRSVAKMCATHNCLVTLFRDLVLTWEPRPVGKPKAGSHSLLNVILENVIKYLNQVRYSLVINSMNIYSYILRFRKLIIIIIL